MATKVIQLHPQNEHGTTSTGECRVNPDSIITKKRDTSGNSYGMEVEGKTFWYCTEAARTADMELVMRARKGWAMLDGLKKYIADNRDIIYTVAFVAVLDQLLFEGAFRERIKTLVESFLAKAEAKSAPTGV